MKLYPSIRMLIILILLLGLMAVSVNAQVPEPDDNTIVVAFSQVPESFDPAQVRGGNSSMLMHMFGQLFELGQASGSINPYLAHSYDISEDGKEWTFHLNEGLTCHDGEALTAEDVVYTFERVMDPANGFTGNTAGFVKASIGYEGVRADGDLDVTIITSMAQNERMRLGLISEVYIHCKDSYEQMSLEEASLNPVGSGPYRFEEWVPGEYLRMSRVADFALRDTYFENIVWRIIPEASTAAAEVITGKVDILKDLPATQVDAINASGVAEVYAYPGTTRVYIGFNMNPDAPFRANPTMGTDAIMQTDVRVALQYAVDAESICQQLLGATCRRATSLVNPPNDHPTLEPYPYDPAKAEELLDAAGYPADANGVRFELELMARRVAGAAGSDVALAVAQYLTDVGVPTEVVFLESADFIEQLINHDLGPIYLGTTGGSTWSAQYDMADIPGTAAGGAKAETNYTNWDSPEWFTLWDSLADLTADPEAERATEVKMLEVFYNDPPWLLLYPGPRLEAVSNRLDYGTRADFFIVVYGAKLKE